MHAALLTIWFIGTTYSFTKGIRFAILMVPAFAVAFGVGIGIIYQYFKELLNKELNIDKRISSVVLVVLVCLLLISPIRAAHNTAMNEIPSFNDAWYESLEEIKKDAEDGIGYITTWWDFGHWFVAHDIRVTFDGGDQGERIHWVGKSLLTDDEDAAIGILRMLNCGQQEAPQILECYLSDGNWEWTDRMAGKGKCSQEIDNSYTIKAIDVLNEIIVEDKEGAKEILKEEGLTDKEIKEVLAVTHCEDLLPQYYIASEDMVGKAGVWGHFGSWDFKRAKMWQTVRNLDVVEGTKVLREDFNLSEEEADNIYYEIQNTKADRWISPWPGYLSGLSGCNEDKDVLRCGNGVEVNLTDMKAVVSTQQGKVSLKSLAYINKNKEFIVKEYDGNAAPYSAALIPIGNGVSSILMDPRLAGSMFTRLFFFDGHGLKHFKILSDKRQVTGGRIQVWKVSWEEGDPINILKEEVIEEIEEEEIKEENNTNSTEEE
jgi:hypothetical protein